MIGEAHSRGKGGSAARESCLWDITKNFFRLIYKRKMTNEDEQQGSAHNINKRCANSNFRPLNKGSFSKWKVYCCGKKKKKTRKKKTLKTFSISNYVERH